MSGIILNQSFKELFEVLLDGAEVSAIERADAMIKFNEFSNSCDSDFNELQESYDSLSEEKEIIENKLDRLAEIINE